MVAASGVYSASLFGGSLKLNRCVLFAEFGFVLSDKVSMVLLSVYGIFRYSVL